MAQSEKTQNSQIAIDEVIETEVLIVGAGIAGLACAVEAEAKKLRYLLITKTVLATGASFFPLKATLGIQVTGDDADKHYFQQDIERVASGMNNPKIVRAYIEDSPHAIALLNQIGFKAWKRNDDRPACFAQFPRPIYLINEWHQAATVAKKIIATHQYGKYCERATLIHIVSIDNHIQGAIFSHYTSGEIRYVFCKTPHIILATGGIAGLYKDNLYPAEVIGSTHIIALQAGAKLTNLEYIQFIPAFVEPKYKVLFGEHTLKYCYQVTDNQNRPLFSHLSSQAFRAMMNERSGYAPFSIDFASAEFDLTMMQTLLTDEQRIYLKYDPQLYEDDSEFYRVYLFWLSHHIGIDLLCDKIAIAPFAHSCNGGIEIDEYAQSAVLGLFAVGEIAAGIEGANRLGGNSVGGALVFSRRAISYIAQHLTHRQHNMIDDEIVRGQVEKALSSFSSSQSSSLSPATVLTQIREKMTRFANVYRVEVHLKRLLAELESLEKSYTATLDNPQSIEIYYALKMAQAIVMSMLARQESRGAHYRADYPQQSTETYRLQLSWAEQKGIALTKIKCA